MDIPIQPTALIVDDNYYNRDLCRLVLEYVGYQVTELESGVQALALLAEQTFDLLILDLAMPELNGVAVLRELKHRDSMPVIVMTANPHMATGEVEENADFVLYKPIDVIEFTSLIGRLSQRSLANK